VFVGFKATNFEKLGGLFSFLFTEDVPDGFSPALSNIRFKPGAVESRPGLGSGAWSKPAHTFYGLSQFLDNLGTQHNLTLDESGNIDQQLGMGVTSVALGVCLPGSRLSTTSLNNRHYMAFYQPEVLPGGSVVALDSLGNLDPVAPLGPATKDHLGSTGYITAGSPTITNVTQIQTWCLGDLIGDSQNAIVGTTNPTTLAYVIAVDYVNNTLTVSQNAVNASNRGPDFLSATLFYPLLYVQDDVLPGQIIAAALVNPGTLYHAGDVLMPTALALGPISLYAINAPGTAYAISDTFLLNNPLYPASVLAQGTVTSVDSSGVVLAFYLTTFGTLYSVATGYVAGTTFGAGHGLTIDVTAIGTGGAGTGGTITINTVDAITGAILTYTANFAGSYNWYPGASFALAGGHGIGATLTITQVADSTYVSGEISAGLHGIAVSFRTRSGAYTEPCALCFWEAAGNRKVVVSYANAQFDLLNTYDPTYTALTFFFTQADDLHIYQIPASIVGASNLLTVIFDFYDTDLTGGDLQDNLYDNERLSDQAGLTQYNSRLVTWGGLATLDLAGMDLLGILEPGSHAFKVPYGWAPGTNNHAALYWEDSVAGQNPGARPGVIILADGATATVGEIWQSEAASVMRPLTSYTVRLWLKQMGGMNAGALAINLIGTNIGGGTGATAGFVIPYTSLTTSWQQFEGAICTASDIPVGTVNNQVAVDLRLRIALTGTAGPFGTGVIISRLQIYPTAAPYDASVIRFSDPYNADRFDGISGFQQVTKDDGERVTSCRTLRWYFYIHKERSMHVTFDDGQNPPSLWTSNLVDSSAGAASPNATLATESFIISAARPGAYVFFGGKPTKLSQEIQTTWDRINWTYASVIHIALDPRLHIVYMLVPLDAETIPSAALILDYTEGFGQEDEPGGRKWGFDQYPRNVGHTGVEFVTPHAPVLPHTINVLSILIGESPTHTQSTWFAGTSIASPGTAKVYLLGAQGDLDDGLAVDSFYETSYARATPNGTSLFGGIAYTLAGSGTLLNSLLPLGSQAGDSREAILQPQTMDLPLTRDLEVYADLETERARARFETNHLQPAVEQNPPTACDYFQVRRVGIYAAPWAPQRVH
jgi:hypothetical protein